MKTLSAVALCAMLFVACKKDAGEGGKAELQGVVLEQRYNSSGNPSGDPYPLADQRVYIIYGDGNYHDDDTRTGPNGEYRFPWLRKGTYKVYTISECNTYQNCTEGIYRSAEISGRKEVLNLATITVRNY